jgi:hypothetical protein
MTTITTAQDGQTLFDGMTVGELIEQLRLPTHLQTKALNAYTIIHALRHLSEWQPIETAPRDGPVLASKTGANPWGVPMILIWLDGPALFYGPGWYQFDRAPSGPGKMGGTPKNPTHWRPLPPGPMKTIPSLS